MKTCVTDTPSFISLVAFVSGFLVLALEVVLQHQLAQVTINSLFSSALVLTLVLVSLTAAAMLLSGFIRLAGDERRALAWALAGFALLCAVQPFLLTALRDGVTILPYELPPLSYLGEVIQLGVLAICPMLLAGGLVFPLLLRRAAGRVRARRAPGRPAVAAGEPACGARCRPILSHAGGRGETEPADAGGVEGPDPRQAAGFDAQRFRR